MESLVRRLGRLFTSEKDLLIEKPLSEKTRRRMEQLDQAVTVWKTEKGWREPSRTTWEVADRLGTDSVTLYYYFKEKVGVDFRTWRTRLRLEDAMQLLLDEPETTAADIALRVGFSNRSNFSRQFLAYTGLTPGRWREKARMSPDIQAPKNDYEVTRI
jgi:AraC-like DNA-binding protein